MIEPRYGNLQKLFADRVFRIPAYQRFYSWRKEQRCALFSDIKTLARNKSEDQHHFMATVVCHRTGETKALGTAEYHVYDIVDGQQRLTTLIILLKCIELALPPDVEVRGELAKILVKQDNHLILLQANNTNADIFDRFVREGVSPEEKDVCTHSDRSLAQAIEDCRTFIDEWKTSSPDITGLMRLILHRLGFVVYDTEDSGIVYTLFEVLNSRGLAVDWIDKCKSTLMGKAHELCVSNNSAQEQVGHLQNIWTNLYKELAKEDLPGDEILRTTATLYYPPYDPPPSKPRSADDSLEQLRNECRSCGSPLEISRRLLEVAQKLTELYSQAHLNAVTEILHARLLAVAIKSARGVTEPERKMLLDQWERVTFRIFGLYAKDSRTKVGDYVRLAARIVTSDINTRTYNQIMDGLHQLGADHPIDNAVNQGLIGQDCYDRSPEQCRYILWNFEEYLTTEHGSGATIDEHERSAIWKKRAFDSVEHIFPQAPNSQPGWEGKMCRSDGSQHPVDQNVGRIGNLLLLPMAMNAAAKASSFDEKKKIYQRHNLRMIQKVCSHSDWTLTQIEEREAQIADWARKRWADI